MKEIKMLLIGGSSIRKVLLFILCFVFLTACNNEDAKSDVKGVEEKALEKAKEQVSEELDTIGPLNEDKAIESFGYKGNVPNDSDLPFDLGKKVGYIFKKNIDGTEEKTLLLNYYAENVNVDEQKPNSVNGEMIKYNITNSKNLIKKKQSGSFGSYKEESIGHQTVYTRYDSEAREISMMWWNGHNEKVLTYITPHNDKEKEFYEKTVKNLYHTIEKNNS